MKNIFDSKNGVTKMLSGGCACGDVQYEVLGKTHWSGICHCEQCKASSGGPFMPYESVDISLFRMSGQKAAVYRSSRIAVRLFCPRCGSPIALLYDGDTEINLVRSSIHEQYRKDPEFSICYENAEKWVFKIDSLKLQNLRNSMSKYMKRRV